jgi:hypothetical protein
MTCPVDRRSSGGHDAGRRRAPRVPAYGPPASAGGPFMCPRTARSTRGGVRAGPPPDRPPCPSPPPGRPLRARLEQSCEARCELRGSPSRSPCENGRPHATSARSDRAAPRPHTSSPVRERPAPRHIRTTKPSGARRSAAYRERGGPGWARPAVLVLPRRPCSSSGRRRSRSPPGHGLGPRGGLLSRAARSSAWRPRRGSSRRRSRSSPGSPSSRRPTRRRGHLP